MKNNKIITKGYGIMGNFRVNRKSIDTTRIQNKKIALKKTKLLIIEKLYFFILSEHFI